MVRHSRVLSVIPAPTRHSRAGENPEGQGDGAATWIATVCFAFFWMGVPPAKAPAYAGMTWLRNLCITTVIPACPPSFSRTSRHSRAGENPEGMGDGGATWVATACFVFFWIPAYAGMTELCGNDRVAKPLHNIVIPAPSPSFPRSSVILAQARIQRGREMTRGIRGYLRKGLAKPGSVFRCGGVSTRVATA